MRERKTCTQRKDPETPRNKISIAKAGRGGSEHLSEGAEKLGVEKIKEAFLEKTAAELGLQVNSIQNSPSASFLKGHL